jgi:hypothetical protein
MAWSRGSALARVIDCSWPAPMIVRGLVPSPVESRKVTLVDYSCHWVTSLVGRFLRCPIVWTRFVQHLLATEPPSVGWHNGDVACRQARESREKIGVSLVKLSRFSMKGKSTASNYNVIVHESNPSHYQLSADIIVIHHRVTSYKTLQHWLIHILHRLI